MVGKTHTGRMWTTRAAEIRKAELVGNSWRSMHSNISDTGTEGLSSTVSGYILLYFRLNNLEPLTACGSHYPAPLHNSCLLIIIITPTSPWQGILTAQSVQSDLRHNEHQPPDSVVPLF